MPPLTASDGEFEALMILNRLFRPRAAQEAGRRLYAAAVAEARRPELYTQLGAPDTNEGRFELYTLHVLLLIERLRREGERGGEVMQALFDTYVKGLDDGLREMGVGDLSVGKKMRKLGEAFYGRGRSYDAAVAALPDETPLTDFIARTTLAGQDPALAPGLVRETLAKRQALAAGAGEALLAGDPQWRLTA